MIDELNIYDSSFKKVIQIADLAAFLIKQLHPDFHALDVEDIVDSFHRDSRRVITLRNTEFSFGGHILHADSLGSANLVGLDSIPVSRFLIHYEMQLEKHPGYSMTARQNVYAHGILDTFKPVKRYEERPQLLSIWFFPRMGKVIDQPPRVIPGSAGDGILQAFFENPGEWYTEKNREYMKQLVNQPVATILGVEFGIPPENATDLQKVLYNVFLLPHEERDYACLESQGIHLNKKEREDIKIMQKENNIFYADGKDAGRAEGMIEGRAEGMMEGRAEGKQEVLNLLKSIDRSAYEKLASQLQSQSSK